MKVLKTVEQFFSSPKGNYPAEYFIKYIVRQHCIQLFNYLKACEKPSFDWIIPDHLKSKEESVSNCILCVCVFSKETIVMTSLLVHQTDCHLLTSLSISVCVHIYKKGVEYKMNKNLACDNIP